MHNRQISKCRTKFLHEAIQMHTFCGNQSHINACSLGEISIVLKLFARGNCTSAIINVEINVTCLRVKVSSVA